MSKNPTAASMALAFAVKPDCASLADSTPFLAPSPTCKGLVIVPKLQTTPLAIDAAIPSAISTWEALSPSNLAQAAAAPKEPNVLGACQPPCRLSRSA